MKCTHRRDSLWWLIIVVALTPELSNAGDWPWVLAPPAGKVVVYQPEIEALSGDTLSARSAVAVTMKGQTEPAFGVMWFRAKVETDKDARMVTLTSLVVTSARFPTLGTDTARRVSAFIEREAPKAHFEFPLDELLTTLQTVEQRARASEDLRNDPPRIIVLEEPALLVLIDGEPKLVPLQGSPLQRLVNTPYFIVYEPTGKKYYLRAGTIWYSATDVKARWSVDANPPEEVTGLASMMADEVPATTDPAAVPPARPPAVVVSTEPCELIATDGPPRFSPIEGTQLLYVTNTPSSLFMDVISQSYYVLFSGRWFAAKSMSGPWSYVAADKLPADFALIPESSPKAYARASVAGTKEAQEAVLDAQIPQTAKVDRRMATLNVEYDGEPRFERIEGTGLSFAVNSSTTVIRTEREYLACDNGIWFTSSSAKGPWAVATSVPEEVYSIPPSSPVYNVTYVYVYESTPDYVYTGYYPGYTGTYLYGPTVVYGTGYYYPPWYGVYYYPRPVTWGFGFLYNPWLGWSMGIAVGGPDYHVSFGWGGGYHGWWGPPMYRPPYYHPGHPPAFAHPSPHARNTNISRNINIYSGRRGAVSKGGTGRPAATPRPSGPTGPRASALPNNVYSDRDGNVYRQSDNGWQKNERSGWQNVSRPQSRQLGSSRTAAPTPLDRQAQARQRGYERSQSYRTSGVSSYPGSGRPQQTRGGGRTGGTRR